MQDVIRAGANAFIPKSAPSQVLINALKVILAGGTYMPTVIVAALRNADGAPGRSELTLRQRELDFASGFQFRLEPQIELLVLLGAQARGGGGRPHFAGRARRRR
jgi:hypothetical protein